MKNEKIKIFAGMMPLKKKEGFLSNCPFITYKDMAVVLKSGNDEAGYGVFSYPALHYLEECIGAEIPISAEMILQSIEDTAERYPVVIKPAEEFSDADDDPGLESELVVYNRMPGGAVAILYPGVIEEIADKLGGDYWILPYSTEFMIVVPDNEKNNRKIELLEKAMPALVDREDFLSKTVYHYDTRSGKVQDIETWKLIVYLRSIAL